MISLIPDPEVMEDMMKVQRQQQVSCYTEGYNARRDGMEPDANPWPEGSDENGWWFNGWINGRGGQPPHHYEQSLEGGL